MPARAAVGMAVSPCEIWPCPPAETVETATPVFRDLSRNSRLLQFGDLTDFSPFGNRNHLLCGYKVSGGAGPAGALRRRRSRFSFYRPGDVSREPESKAHYSVTPFTKWNRGCYDHPRFQFEIVAKNQAVTDDAPDRCFALFNRVDPFSVDPV